MRIHAGGGIEQQIRSRLAHTSEFPRSGTISDADSQRRVAGRQVGSTRGPALQVTGGAEALADQAGTHHLIAAPQQAAIGRIGSAPSLPDQAFQLSIQAQGRLTTPEEFGDVVIRATEGGSFVRLKDVARVELGTADVRRESRYDGTTAISIGIVKTAATAIPTASCGAGI